MEDLFIDIETFSSVDLPKAGLYKYVESPDFKIILISYAFGKHGEIITVDLTKDSMPDELEEAFFDTNVRKHAHNATFERVCLRRIGYNIQAKYWHCTAVKSGYCGLPFSLGEVSKKLNIENKKLDTGTLLIKYFSCPCKPTHTNGQRIRNLPTDSPAKWQQYIDYNRMDVAAEREIFYILEQYKIPEFERALYLLDQQINDTGVMVNLQLANNAITIDEWFSEVLAASITELTGIANPNSPAQIKDWFLENTGDYVEAISKETLPGLLDRHKDNPTAMSVLEARQQLGKSSIKKYTAMINSATKDSRSRGLFQFYGASRTGRWAGRLIQLQNLPKNYMKNIDLARTLVLDNDSDTLEMVFGNVSQVLSQLIRTAFIPANGYIYHVADFSAIEARVISWLASETWRLDVFRGHGKIYEASASRMFNVPIEMVTKTSDLRFKAKTAELALGYQGSIGAMKRMGGESMGLSDAEMMSIVKKWRIANPNIVEMWDEYDNCAIEAVMYKTEVMSMYQGILFNCNGSVLTIELPSGHKLYYRDPSIVTNKFGKASVCYYGIIQDTKLWGRIDTYGGKLTENIVQAIARDVLGYAMLQLNNAGYNIVMHIHDEVVIEHPDDDNSKLTLEHICSIMSEDIPWAHNLPLNAEGFSTYYYKKD